VPAPFRREPTALERILGRRRARMLRRRLGVLALGCGYSLVRPRRTTTWTAATATMSAVLLVAVVALH
jgi:hypothetical protein